MKREEFIKKYKNDCLYYFDGYYSDCIDDFLTNIYNDHEAQLKAKDEHIKELEEAMTPKSCSTCKFEGGKYCYDCQYTYPNRYKPKDNA